MRVGLLAEMQKAKDGRWCGRTAATGAIVLALLVWLPHWAQGQSRRSGGLDRAKTFLVLRLAEALDLTTEEALRISGILRKAQERRRELRREGEAVIEEIQAELDRRPVRPERLQQLTNRGNQLYRELALIPEQSFEEAQSFLNAEQRARLILFRYEWMTKLQKELRRRQERRPAR